MKKWVSEFTGDSKRKFVIEEDDNVGFYLYIFEGDKCKEDYLQDSFDLAIEQAEEDFGVDPRSWRQITS